MKLTVASGAKLAGALLAVLALALGACLLVLSMTDWNRARPWIDARVSTALGRPFHIAGPLTLGWGAPDLPGRTRWLPWPYLEARELHLASGPGYADAPDLLTVARCRFAVDPLALFSHRLVIPHLRLDDVQVQARRGADGKANWQLTPPAASGNWQLALGQVALGKVDLHLVDLPERTDLVAAATPLAADPHYALVWSMSGHRYDSAITASGNSGALLALAQGGAPFPFSALVHNGSSILVVEGTATHTGLHSEWQLRLAASGADMAKWYPVLPFALPATPPYSVQGRLHGTLAPGASDWQIDQLQGRLGHSDFGGALRYRKQGGQRALITGQLRAEQLHLADLASLFGADSNAAKRVREAPPVQPANKVLPVEPFRSERWQAADADLQLVAVQVVRASAPAISSLDADFHLHGGVISFTPLRLGIAGGKVEARIELDGRARGPILAKAHVQASRLQLQQLLPAIERSQASLGHMGGEATLTARGDSLASLLAGADGRVQTLMSEGTISKLLLEEMGLNLGNVLATRLTGDHPVRLVCMATDFSVEHGVMRTRAFVVDTDDALIDVNGQLNLASERIDLVLRTNSKQWRLVTLRSPIHVSGTLQQPKVALDKGSMALRAGGALALAALNPLAALLPLMQPGPGQSSTCAPLLAKGGTAAR